MNNEDAPTPSPTVPNNDDTFRKLIDDFFGEFFGITILEVYLIFFYYIFMMIVVMVMIILIFYMIYSRVTNKSKK